MNYKIVLTYLTLAVYTLASHYLSGYYGALKFILSLIIYTLVFYSLHYIWSKIRKKALMYFSVFINYFLMRVSIFLLFITVFFGGLTYLSNEVYPAPMPEYTITNGTKTIKFQAMSHIGTENFYNTVAENLTKYKEAGGVYFYEGVKPGTEENLEKFNKAIGIEFDEDLYENFSKLYGVTNQNNEDFFGLVNNLDFNIDLNMDEIMLLYEIKIDSKPEGEKEFENKLPIDANKTILETLSTLNDKQLRILIYINQAILNFIMSSEGTQGFLSDNFTNKDLFDVILDERNEVLTKAIIESEYEKIYITYGLLHFDGVFKLLKETDPKWQISSVQNLYPIKN